MMIMSPCGCYLMYFCYFVISTFTVNKSLILNKLIVFISTVAVPTQEKFSKITKIIFLVFFFKSIILRELILTAINFHELCQIGLKDRGPLFNDKFLTKRIIIVNSDIPFCKTSYQTETCHLIMQCKSIDWFLYDKKFFWTMFRNRT